MKSSTNIILFSLVLLFLNNNGFSQDSTQYEGLIKLNKSEYYVAGPLITLYKNHTFKWFRDYDVSWFEYGKYKILNDTLILSYYKIDKGIFICHDNFNSNEIQSRIDSVREISKIQKYIIHGDGLYSPKNKKFKTETIKIKDTFHDNMIPVNMHKKYKYYLRIKS